MVESYPYLSCGKSIYKSGRRAKGWSVDKNFRDYWIPEPNSGCHLWIGFTDGPGYAEIQYDGRTRRASHVALELAGRPITPGLFACHKCDNPLCVNPDHLFEGDAKANALDMAKKGRAPVRVKILGEDKKNARFDNKTILEIRAELENGMSMRACGRKHGVNASHIFAIKNRILWAHI